LTQINKLQTGLSGEADDLSGSKGNMGGVPLPPPPAGKWLPNWDMGRRGLIHPRDSDPKNPQNKKHTYETHGTIYTKEDPNHENHNQIVNHIAHKTVNKTVNNIIG